MKKLISQMILEGYLYQTDDQYSMLKLVDISPLQNEDGKVIVKMYEEKESSRRESSHKRRSTDSLTSAGFDRRLLIFLKFCVIFVLRLQKKKQFLHILYSMTKH